MPRPPQVICNHEGFGPGSQGNYGFTYLILQLVDRIMELESHVATSTNVYRDFLNRVRPFCLHNLEPNTIYKYLEESLNDGRNRYSKQTPGVDAN
jgi:hypothetical protein